MKSDDQITLERTPPTAASKENRVNAGIKSILVHVQNDKSVDRRVQAALSIARACDAHLSFLHVTPVEAYVAFDSFGGIFVMSEVMQAIDDEARSIRSTIESDLRLEDVTWDYEEVTGNIRNQIVSHAALADLIVTGREPHSADFQGPSIGILGDLLYRTRTPLFIPGDTGPPADLTGTALIAWDGSYEAANAVRASLGLLKIASDVRILKVEEKKDESFPSTKLLEYLSRHGIHAELTIASADGDLADREMINCSLLAHAVTVGAAYIVMGGYSHSRVGEYLFGGVTRTLLASSPVALMIAH